MESESRNEKENAEQEEGNLVVDTQETQPEGNTHIFTEDVAANDRSSIYFTTPLASSPPIENRDFIEIGESSRGASKNNQIMEMLQSMQKGMEERDKKWNLQQQFKEETYETELKRRDQQWEEELQRREEMFEAELRKKEKKWEEKMSRKEEQLKKVMEHKE